MMIHHAALDFHSFISHPSCSHFCFSLGSLTSVSFNERVFCGDALVFGVKLFQIIIQHVFLHHAPLRSAAAAAGAFCGGFLWRGRSLTSWRPAEPTTASSLITAELMKRPPNGFSFTLGPLSHSGVRVTLADGSQWLVHQGENHGVSSDTVVVDARHMSSAWQTVADLVAAGGTDYSFFFDNCHMATQRMMTHGVSPFSCRSSISPTCRAASAPAAPAPSSRTTSCGTTSHSYDLSGSELRRIYNSPVFMAERLKRPLDGQSVRIGPISHSGKVADFVAVGGTDYSVFFDNCHLASRRMMGQL
ncbi:hypothetical protein F7725_017715 [Dissostichus mawsoni]|uniref:Uncharacterized protein n=1 Tax=Dissostichus mawsoni TaxID=36200 RepID=A0A7J5XSC7_DISMA|nr:hypothetical protein F7725_017715 [Dissostichus mawsoni]